MNFPTTHWSLLAVATSSGDEAARRALEELCRRYWSPVNQFIQFRGHRGAEADDLTQEFFLHLCRHSTFSRADRERGRFRSFLLGALVKFLANESDRARAQKRGGGVVPLNLDEIEVLEAPSVPAEVLRNFDREWATAVLAAALTRITEEFSASGREQVFTGLKAFLPGAGAPPSYEEAARQLGLTVAAFKTEVHRMRLRLRALVREEVANTVTTPHEIESELAHLQAVLMERGQELGEGRNFRGPVLENPGG